MVQSPGHERGQHFTRRIVYRLRTLVLGWFSTVLIIPAKLQRTICHQSICHSSGALCGKKPSGTKLSSKWKVNVANIHEFESIRFQIEHRAKWSKCLLSEDSTLVRNVRGVVCHMAKCPGDNCHNTKCPQAYMSNGKLLWVIMSDGELSVGKYVIWRNVDGVRICHRAKILWNLTTGKWFGVNG